MSLSINWATKVITIPQTYLDHDYGIYYKLDVNQFRLDLKDIEDSDEGITFLDTHRHNTEVTVAGITLARVVEIINGYTITFEDGQYVVTLTGGNNNILDVVNANQVSVQSTNSAGLIVSGSGITEQDKEDIANEVWDHTTGTQISSDLDDPDQYKADVTNLALEASVQAIQTDLDNPSQYQADLTDLTMLAQTIEKMLTNRLKITESTNTLTIYDDDNVTPFKVFNLKNKAGTPASENVYERVPQ